MELSLRQFPPPPPAADSNSMISKPNIPCQSIYIEPGPVSPYPGPVAPEPEPVSPEPEPVDSEPKLVAAKSVSPHHPTLDSTPFSTQPPYTPPPILLEPTPCIQPNTNNIIYLSLPLGDNIPPFKLKASVIHELCEPKGEINKIIVYKKKHYSCPGGV